MKTELIKDILTSAPDGRIVTVCGWVRTIRDSKNLVFIQVMTVLVLLQFRQLMTEI